MTIEHYLFNLCWKQLQEINSTVVRNQTEFALLICKGTSLFSGNHYKKNCITFFLVKLHFFKNVFTNYFS